MAATDRFHDHIGFKDPEDVRVFRRVLSEVGYEEASILRALHVPDTPSLKGTDIALLLHRTESGSPLDTLTRLFLMEVPVSVEALEEAAYPMSAATLEEAGLIAWDEETVLASVKLLPFRQMVLAFDSPRRLQSRRASDYVMGVGNSTLTLANLTVRRKVGACLDLGTGCGIQAFLAAEHSDRVVATDRNPRALQFARFNAELNGFQNIEFREGDLFQPVLGETFDLIVSSPPFVISPEEKYLFRDGGMDADGICRRIVEEAPGHLNEGGFCQILANWAEKVPEDWHNQLLPWFQGNGCDVWVMRSETRDAATYASSWITHTERDEPEKGAARLRTWTDYYQELGIQAVSAGIIILRRSIRENPWFWAEDAPEKMIGPCGPYLLRGFVLRDFLEDQEDDLNLLGVPLKVAPEVRLHKLWRHSAQGWTEEEVIIQLSRGFAYQGHADTFLEGLLARCDGKTPIRELLPEMAESMGIEQEVLLIPLCGIVRSLVERGFLLPAGSVQETVDP